MMYKPLGVRLKAKQSAVESIPFIAWTYRANFSNCRNVVEEIPVMRQAVVAVAPVRGGRDDQVDRTFRQFVEKVECISMAHLDRGCSLSRTLLRRWCGWYMFFHSVILWQYSIEEKFVSSDARLAVGRSAKTHNFISSLTAHAVLLRPQVVAVWRVVAPSTVVVETLSRAARLLAETRSFRSGAKVHSA